MELFTSPCCFLEVAVHYMYASLRKWSCHVIDIWSHCCRICYETQKWGLLSKYAKRFIKAGGVNLRQATIDMWMEFAAKRGLNCCLSIPDASSLIMEFLTFITC